MIIIGELLSGMGNWLCDKHDLLFVCLGIKG